MKVKPKRLRFQGNRFEALSQQIMKTLYVNRSEALAMATEMVIWELIFAARSAGISPERAQGVA